MNDTVVISLVYEETWFKQTLNCLEKLDVDILFADRSGVGSIPLSFNNCFLRNFERIVSNYKYIWFITDIIFDPKVLSILRDTLEAEPAYAAVCPTYDSDHKHLQKVVKGRELIIDIPFVEFTCPMVRTDVFSKILLDESFWFYYHDLVWSMEVKELGYRLACNQTAQITHVYLRNGPKEQITRLREKLRILRESVEPEILLAKYGSKWREILWCR